jgi:hypothetical protein
MSVIPATWEAEPRRIMSSKLLLAKLEMETLSQKHFMPGEQEVFLPFFPFLPLLSCTFTIKTTTTTKNSNIKRAGGVAQS